ncbi:uncharacterized protein LAESUDRAFT_719207 [Laetiporus sulphureus 93-53]|uniref:WDR59/RTC1-like RING zinc finger domain-containing protein n=1 Tax=Laetiporus sulphureus 93-53 TaxID=1314785 RepID=A0A165ICQ5_9APHY|nr:uncharacterized protein LAESUDRAFT_719207 [Laetiporus sulphureus 93-53]KZT12899.1 hypothetical protein LAESUDRAFT_719207 [Laetiporus sulphureus 93-53]
MSSAVTIRPGVVEPPSTPEDESNFRQSLQIDMKGLVGDAVGNMSISPGSRDVVLATRNGLFIIDLEAPLNVPRFLPQGGTWDVADVQWNPHPSRSEYIVSTSSEKLLIWNLFLTGKTSIEHVLRSHYRAITDINWHTTEPDIVVSTGIDSWLWAWDLRATQKPVMGLCAFGAGGTQVKWNRQDGNLLASSHQNVVLLWDRRKGSLPVAEIKAHSAKIYGIDWAHGSSTELLTCSLDKSIKMWDTQIFQPKLTIQTAYPVWRARDLPFGRGVLSLPQRGETALELYAYETPESPIELFEGHTDVVKEFVWRRGGYDNSEFQLITWSKDKTLRFWPVDTDVMQRAGRTTPTHSSAAGVPSRKLKISFSNAPVGMNLTPALSAPIGNRSILAEVRAPYPLRPSRTNIRRNPSQREASDSSSVYLDRDTSVAPTKPIPIAQEKGGTMTRGHLGARSARITTFAWLSSVKVGAKRDSSSGQGSGAEKGNLSRVSSRSRPSSLLDQHVSGRAPSLQKGHDATEEVDDDHREGEVGQSVQDEITSVVNKLSASKVKLEKADLTKKRSCTFGLHGPWGDSTSVFIRVTFTFPRDYPDATYPHGIPSVDLERNPLISIKNRAYILRRLRTIREHERPCLEKCLRFLLFGDDGEQIGRRPGIESESSSDEEGIPSTRTRGRPSFSSVRNDKNLAEPRTSQGVFGVNGELICFSRAPPRIVRNPMREMSESPSLAPHGADASFGLFHSPALVSDAIRNLGYAARDRDNESVELQQAEDANNILRIMTNLFTVSQRKPRRISENSRHYEDIPSSYSLVPTRRSTVTIRDASKWVGIDVAAAGEYTFSATQPTELCRKNAAIAIARGRSDHARILGMLEAALTRAEEDGSEHLASHQRTSDRVVVYVVNRIYQELIASKDIQMLAFISVLLLQTSSSQTQASHQMTPDISTPDFSRSLRQRNPSLSPIWSHALPSPTTQPVAPALSSPTSSKGSWSSLFTGTSMKQFVTGPKARLSIPMSEDFRNGRRPSVHYGSGKDITTPTTKSWTEDTKVDPVLSAVTFSSAGHTRHRTFSQIISARPSHNDRKRLIVKLSSLRPYSLVTLQQGLCNQLLCHIFSYAQMLLAWNLPSKRTELLKAVENDIHSTAMDASIMESLVAPDCLGVVRICKHGISDPEQSCPGCGGRATAIRCSVCRLPVKGLSYSCLSCMHVSHVSCWEGIRGRFCATGCGCQCVQPLSTLSTAAERSLPLLLAA